MADLFNTSFPAAASRFASLSDIPCAFVTMERGAVRYAARSTSLRKAGAWISPRSAIPVGSVAHRLRSAGSSAADTDEVAQDIWFDNWEKGLDLWELSRHYARTDTTTSLLWFDSEDLPEVEVNRFGVRVEDDGGLAELTGSFRGQGGASVASKNIRMARHGARTSHQRHDNNVLHDNNACVIVWKSSYLDAPCRPSPPPFCITSKRSWALKRQA